MGCKEILFSSGERISFELIYKRYFYSLVSFAQNYLECNEECKSVVQEVIIAIHEGKREFSNEVHLRSFLYESVRNGALNYLKKIKVRKNYSDTMMNVDDHRQIEPSFIHSMIKEEVYRILFETIDELPSHLKQVCLLILDNQSNDEIAEHIGVSVNTIKYHKKHLYKELRARLSKEVLCYVSFFMEK